MKIKLSSLYLILASSGIISGCTSLGKLDIPDASINPIDFAKTTAAQRDWKVFNESARQETFFLSENKKLRAFSFAYTAAPVNKVTGNRTQIANDFKKLCDVNNAIWDRGICYDSRRVLFQLYVDASQGRFEGDLFFPFVQATVVVPKVEGMSNSQFKSALDSDLRNDKRSLSYGARNYKVMIAITDKDKQVEKDAELYENKKNEQQALKQKQNEQNVYANHQATQPQVKTIGQQICKNAEGTESRVIAVSIGRPIYSDPVKRTYRITAVTEQVAANRISVRIGSILSEVAGRTVYFDKLDGTPVYQTGQVLWDDAINWLPCN